MNMEPHDQNQPEPGHDKPLLPPVDLARLQERFITSKTVKRAIRWQCRVQSFRSLPPFIRFSLGGSFALALLEIAADVALEDYLTEAMTWH